MKKSFFLILIINIIPIFSQDLIEIDTVYGKQELVIPDNYEELKEYYIDISKLYLERRKQVEDLLIIYDELLEHYQGLDSSYSKILEIDENLIDLAKRKSIYKQFIQIGIGGDYFTNNRISILYSGLLFDSFLFTTAIEYPVGFSINLGIQF